MDKFVIGEFNKIDTCVLICGTFNPITNAHLQLAQYSKRSYPNADIIFIPSNFEFMRDWKETDEIIIGSHRTEMLRATLENTPYILSNIEIKNVTDGKTINTVTHYKKFYNNVVLCFGSDKVFEFKQWYNFNELKDLVSFLIVTRSDDVEEISKCCTSLCIENYEIIKSSHFSTVSSTKVRRAFYKDQLDTIKNDVPRCVFSILTNLLKSYKNGEEDTYEFDPVKVRQELVDKIKQWFEENGSDCNAIIGISGGKDSTVAAALCCEALGKERVIPVLMPNGKQNDIDDSFEVCEALGIADNSFVVNINDAYEGLLNAIEPKWKKFSSYYTKQTLSNLPPRLRMSTLYALGQTMKGRVINTSNMSERYVGWGTLYGDTVGDVSLFGNLTATEVVAIGNTYEELPKHLVNKTPSDGLTGKSDEENLGFTYEVLDRYIRTGFCLDRDIKNMIDKRHKDSEFKRNGMTIL